MGVEVLHGDKILGNTDAFRRVPTPPLPLPPPSQTLHERNACMRQEVHCLHTSQLH